MFSPQTISKRLTSLRGKKSVETVAKDLNIGVSAMYMYERGERVPRDPMKIKFAEYYGCSVEDIFFKDMYTIREQK